MFQKMEISNTQPRRTLYSLLHAKTEGSIAYYQKTKVLEEKDENINHAAFESDEDTA